MALDSLYGLLMEQLRDIYQAETRMVPVLARMAQAASTPALRAAFEAHLSDTENQVCRLEQAYAEFGVAPHGKPCRGMEGLLDETKEIMAERGPEGVLDAALIGVAHRVEHYEIAAYGTVISLAQVLGERMVAELLQRSLDEERAAEARLSVIAEDEVNGVAVAAGSENVPAA